MKFDVYFAAPFFCDAEKLLNNALLDAFEDASIKVFYPFRDGILAKREIENGRSINDVMNEVWTCDTESIQNSKIIFAILDGRTVDEGVCVEIGYASALSKKIIGYYSDNRSCFKWGFNPMISEPIAEFSSNIESAVEVVLRHLSQDA